MQISLPSSICRDIHRGRRTLLLLAALFGLTSLANATGEAPTIVHQGLGMAMSQGVIVQPMHKGQLQTEISGSYLMVKSQNQGWSTDMKGWAGTASATYGLSEHWGVSFLAGNDNVYGDNTLSFITPDGKDLTPTRLKNNPALKNSGGLPSADHGHGIVTSLSMVWDHWSGDGFRMPVYFGAGYTHMVETSDAAAFGVKRTGDISAPSVLVGFAPSFPIRKFRAMGFFMVSSPLTRGTGAIFDSTNGTSQGFDLAAPPDAAVPIIGLDLTYTPWGLGFTYTPDITGEGVTAYSLKWAHPWGGPAH